MSRDKLHVNSNSLGGAPQIKLDVGSGGSIPSDKGVGERGGHPDPETRAGSLKKIFSALRASVSSKIKGGPSVHSVYIVTLLDHEVMNV